MQILLKQATLATLVITALLIPIIGQAATYYVATSGNNSNPGTSTKPWRTVAYATGKMVAGDTTYVRGGIYNEGIVRFGTSGTKSAPIKLLSAPGEFPVIHCSKGGRVLFQNRAGSKTAIGWITIEGFEIRYCNDNIKMYNGHDLTIRRNWLHHSDNQGIIGYGTRILVDRNRINHNGAFTTCTSCGKQHGIYGSGTGWTITNNLIYDNLAYGIQLDGASSSTFDPTKHAGPEFAASANWVIVNNTFAYNANRGGMVVWGSTCSNARIENNIFYENAVKQASNTAQGIDFTGATCKGVAIKNNLAFASGSGGTKFIGGTAPAGSTQTGNIVNTLKPAFVNAPVTLPSSPNFALPSGSLAIDKGLVNSIAKVAFNGTTRPKGSTYDVGAYEYNGSTSQLMLAAPTSAQVN